MPVNKINIGEAANPSKYLATHEIQEGSNLVQLQRIVLSDSSGSEIPIAQSSNFTSGNGKFQLRSGAKGISNPADITSTSIDGNTQALDVTVKSSSLPSGAATSALQNIITGSLLNIDSKTPALGQKIMASSSAVVIASDQTSIPVTGSVQISNFPSSQVVTGSVLTDISSSLSTLNNNITTLTKHIAINNILLSELVNKGGTNDLKQLLLDSNLLNY